MSTQIQNEQGVGLLTGSSAPNNSSEGPKKDSPQKARGQWANKAEYLLAVVGHIVGLGNIWRFPYLCYKNGGGVFLVPYLLFLVLSGIPLFLLETSMGQYTSLGGVMAWRSFCPLFGGVGYATQLLVLHGNVYYITVLVWALFYLVNSFQWPLPWSHCNNTWNTENCFVSEGRNLTANGTALPENGMSSVMEFWEREVLQLSSRMEDLSPVSWRLALCLLGIWILCYFSVWKGVKSTGKVVYFTATFPYVTLLVLLIRGVTLPGAGDGIIYYLKPNYVRLADPQVWMDAGTQIFFSSGVCMGCLIALGSYNRFNNDCLKDCFTLCILNSATSIVAGFAVFSILGFMAQEQGIDISEVAQSGPGLAFIVFPRAIAMMPFPQFWGVCFFLMIILLGLDSQFVGIESLMTSLTDLYPTFVRKGYRRELLLLLMSIVSFLLGLILTTPGGLYVFQIYDHYSYSGPGLLLLSILETLAVGWIYGSDRYCDVLQSMTGYRPWPIFKVCWSYVTPAFCVGIFVFSLVWWPPVTLAKGVVAPGWAIALGWLLCLSNISPLPLWTTYALLTTPGSLRQRICQLRNGAFTPSPENEFQAIELQPPAPKTDAKVTSDLDVSGLETPSEGLA
ncbi:sodium- and chloride-dependent GABA transporter 2-like [Anguilla rostrata]|uniref:sodium- and chloride-dependent GABA transporter 2-like n=1 Tax=Anguilla rostrata TaxID=7938 RepID=UPI0030CAEF8F